MKVTLEQIDGMDEKALNELLSKVSKSKSRLEQRGDELRKIIGRAHARLNELARRNQKK